MNDVTKPTMTLDGFHDAIRNGIYVRVEAACESECRLVNKLIECVRSHDAGLADQLSAAVMNYEYNTLRAAFNVGWESAKNPEVLLVDTEAA